MVRITESKAALRTRMRQALRELLPERREAESRAACALLCALPAFAQADLLLAYMATAWECNPAFAVEQAYALNKRVAFPRCAGEHSLELYVPKGPDAFIQGRYGIMEPLPVRCERVEAAELGFIIVPGLAFDASCMRLGQGGGYYDRFLAHTHAIRVGLAFSIQIVEQVPVEMHDIPLDYIVTPQKRFTSLS